MTAFLVLPDGSRVPVTDDLVIGRVVGCGVVVVDAKVSRRHARLISQGGVVEVEDLGSSNGTRVNGRPLQKRRMLRNEDVVTVGLTDLRFETMAQTPEETASSGFAAGEDIFGADETPLPPPSTEPGADTAGVAPNTEVASPELVAPPAEDLRQSTALGEAPESAGESARDPTGDAVDEVLVFADDEVVTVRKPSGVSTPSRAGVLQFNKVEAREGFGSQDIRQMSGGPRLLMFSIVIAVAVGLFYLGMTLIS